MKQPNDGGFAFPSGALDSCANPGCEAGPMRGMTLRQYYAGKALQGCLAMMNPDTVTHCIEKVGKDTFNEAIARQSRTLADALIAELEKGQP